MSGCSTLYFPFIVAVRSRRIFSPNPFLIISCPVCSAKSRCRSFSRPFLATVIQNPSNAAELHLLRSF